MVEEKGLDGAVADQIGQWVCLRGGEDIIKSLEQNQALAANQKIQEGIADLNQLFQYLKASDSMAGVSFDLSLARGL
jgi:histidyl-tRNA synthetase